MIDIINKVYIETTKQEFFQAKDAFRDDIVNRAWDAGISSEGQQNAARVMAAKNNPIELIRK